MTIQLNSLVVKIYSKPKAHDFVTLLISFNVSNVRFDSFAFDSSVTFSYLVKTSVINKLIHEKFCIISSITILNSITNN